MNRKQISKGLKILSIASAVIVCSATMATSERADAGGFTTFRIRLGNWLRGRGFTTNPRGTTNLQRPAATTTSQLQTGMNSSNANDNSLNISNGNRNDGLKVKFRGIGKGGKTKSVKGVLDGATGNSTTNGNVDSNSVVKIDDGVNGRSRLDTSGNSQEFKFPTGHLEDGIHYAALGARPKIKIQNGGAQGSNTTSGATEGNTIYSEVKGSPTGNTSGTTSGTTSSQASSSIQNLTSTTSSDKIGRRPIPTPRTNQDKTGRRPVPTPRTNQDKTGRRPVPTPRTNLGNIGKKPIPTPRKNQESKQQQQQSTSSDSEVGNAGNNVKTRSQSAGAILTTTTGTTSQSSGNKPDRIPAVPKKTLNERLGLDKDGKRIIKPQAQDTTTTTSSETGAKKKSPGFLTKLFGGKKSSDKTKDTSSTTSQSSTSSATGSGSDGKTGEKKSIIPKLELKIGGNKKTDKSQQTSDNKAPDLPERPRGLATKSDMTNDWDPVRESSEGFYGPNVKLDKWGLPEIDGFERDFEPVTRPGYGGTVMVLRRKK